MFELNAVLFSNITFAEFNYKRWKNKVPKSDLQPIINAFEKCFEDKSRNFNISTYSRNNYVLYYKKTAYNWLNFCKQMPPCYDESGNSIDHTQYGNLYFENSQP